MTLLSYSTPTVNFMDVFSHASSIFACLLSSEMSPMLTVIVSTGCASVTGFTLNEAVSFDLSYKCTLPPSDRSLYNITVHSDAPGMVRRRYLPLATLLPSTVTSSENEITVPLFAPVRHILPYGVTYSGPSPKIFLPRILGLKYSTWISVSPTTVDTVPLGLAAGMTTCASAVRHIVANSKIDRVFID